MGRHLAVGANSFARKWFVPVGLTGRMNSPLQLRCRANIALHPCQSIRPESQGDGAGVEGTREFLKHNEPELTRIFHEKPVFPVEGACPR